MCRGDPDTNVLWESTDNLIGNRKVEIELINYYSERLQDVAQEM